jgi:hypothetical protein
MNMVRTNESVPSSVTIEVSAHGANYAPGESNDKPYYGPEHGVLKFRPHVSHSEIWGFTNDFMHSPLARGFYHFWISSGKLRTHQFSNQGIDPSVEMLDTYLNSAMHESILKKWISFTDTKLKILNLPKKIDVDTRTEMMSFFFNIHRAFDFKDFIGKNKKSEEDIEAEKAIFDFPDLYPQMRPQPQRAAIITQGEEYVADGVDFFCKLSENLDKLHPVFKYGGIETDVDKLREMYCDRNVPSESSAEYKQYLQQGEYYKDALNKRVPQGFGEQKFEKGYSFNAKNAGLGEENERGGKKGLSNDPKASGITVMLTTNLNENQMRALASITTTIHRDHHMFEDDVTGKYDEVDHFRESKTIKRDVKEIVVHPKYIPGVEKWFDKEENDYIYRFTLSNLVRLLKDTAGIDNIYIHEYSCDGFHDNTFKATDELSHVNTITRRGGSRIFKKMKNKPHSRTKRRFS